MKTAAAYIRVSDERQDEYSPDSQLKLIYKYAEAHDFDLPNEYIFYDDGISGKTVKARNAFNDMIAVAKDKSHPIDAILVWKFSRFARNQEESIVYKSLLARNNVEVISVSEPIVDGPFGSLIERIIEWMDEYYVIRLSDEVKRGMAEKVSRGEPICAPAFGYDIRDKHYYPNDDAEIVRDVFHSYLAGETCRGIAIRLANSGVRTRYGNLPDNRWIEYMLRNPVYIGMIRWCTDGRGASARDYHNPANMIVKGKHEPIIDLETWNAVQAKLDHTKTLYPKWQRRDPADWPLKGLVRCSSCGATLVRNVSIASLQCHNYSRGQCNSSHSITFAKAEASVLNALQTACLELNFSFAKKDKPTPTSDNADIEKQIKAERRRLDRAKEAFLNGLDTLEEYGENKKKYQNRIKELRNKLETISPEEQFDKEAFAARVSDVVDIFKDPTSSPALKNQALRTVVDHIVFRKKEMSFDVFFHT